MLKYFFISFLIFCLSFWGIFLTRKNFLIILMSIEMMLLSINLNFIIFSLILDDLIGQLFALFVLTVAAGESAVGLALLVIYYRIKGIISIDFISSLKG
jgi:NADH-quinone oxidoreductase subunit K